MSRAESKKAAKDLLELCKDEGVKVPTDPLNAMIVAGTMLNATKENGEFKMDLALEAMIEKFGKKESPVKKRKAADSAAKETKAKGGKVVVIDDDDEEEPVAKKAKKATATKKGGKKVKAEDGDEEEDDVPKKPKAKSKPVATCEENQAMADIFAELSGFEFKRGERFKGGTWSKVAKAIRDAEAPIITGKDAMKLKGVGKSSASMIDEFLETGTLAKVEEFRAGNL
ncbi:TPA: hypothetical protein N0F65_008646 [Lagenidium giganteum]|uniref:Crossover junction endonuclease MUS81-like HHH domain-containing protein n=1 Tax=Lagenidium giganteum TaxID=4803 RepID=A0AAV2Z9X5_9STRA|nr:TPA: hypothetical protein N0F65_008646 [Lagenidium giganteum]